MAAGCVDRVYHRNTTRHGRRHSNQGVRCYTSQEYTAVVVIELDQKMRAFVRPLHGEILVIKSDNHPSYKAKSTREHMVESEMSPQFSPD